MTEQFKNPYHDSRMHPHRLLLDMLSRHLHPQNERVEVVWGRHPTLLVGGVLQFQDTNRNIKPYNFAVNRYPWANNLEPQYDVHVFNENNARRYAVYENTIYTAHNIGRLTADSLIKEAKAGTAHKISRWLCGASFSLESTHVAHKQLSEWGIVEQSSELDEMYPDMGVYHFTEILKQEQMSGDE